MHRIRNLLTKLKRFRISLLLGVIGASIILVAVNYYSTRITSASRAFINGESNFSKGYKDAVHHLVHYLYNNDTLALERFDASIAIPLGDNAARDLMETGGPDSLVKIALRIGRNHEDDLVDVIWMFKTFGSISFMAEAIREWHAGDSALAQLQRIAREIHQQRLSDGLTAVEQQAYHKQIAAASAVLDLHANVFSELLGEANRGAKRWLFVVNIFVVLLIIWIITAYFLSVFNRITRYKDRIVRKNKQLRIANQELDRFVYSASHELRSPITSLMGLVRIAEMEEDPRRLKEYLRLMERSLTRQDAYIQEIIDYSKNKRLRVNTDTIHLERLVDEVIAQHRHAEEATDINFITELTVDEVSTDHYRLKIILNNLLSNAIRFADPSKEKKTIFVRSRLVDGHCEITVADNGVGIEEEYIDKVFGMFFRIGTEGAGLGLYIAREAAKSLRGTLSVDSKIAVGSTFVLTVPIL